MNAIKTLANRFRNGLNRIGQDRDASRRRRRTTSRLQLEGLEGRELMTGSATLSSAGALQIEGSVFADTAVITQVYDMIVVELSGADGSYQVGAAPASKVKNIVFYGHQGNDVFNNQTSIPCMAHGGQGNDLLIGGNGPCELLGGKGDDVLVGGAANDVLYGNEGNDIIDGGAGDDILYGGQGNDYVIGGTGNDALFGNKGVDLLLGGSGNDRLDGGDDVDFLDGGTGYDRISDGAGVNYFYDNSGSTAGSYAGTGWMVNGHAFNDDVWALDILNLIISYRQTPSQTGGNSAMFKSTPGSFWSATIPELGMTLGELTQAPNFWRH